MNKDSFFVKNTFVLARDNDHAIKFKLAAQLVHKKDVLSVGMNSFHKTHPFQLKYGANKMRCYWHAETNAIFNALKNGVDESILKKSTLYIARARYYDSTSTSYMTGYSEPCSGCMKCIMEHNIGRVVFTCDGTKDVSLKYSVMEF